MQESRNGAASRRNGVRIALAAAFSTAVLGLVGAGVFAGLSATATGTQSVSGGTLSLIVTPDVGAGFGQSYSNVAPGDTMNSYVVLTNGSSLAAQAMTLQVVGTGSTLLTTDATRGLHVTVTQCSVAWTLATGTCTGTTTTLLASTSVSTLASTPGSVIPGTIAVNAVYHLQVSLTLPNQSETTVNGTVPSNSIQGLSTTLTYTFDEAQRSATTTNS